MSWYWYFYLTRFMFYPGNTNLSSLKATNINIEDAGIIPADEVLQSIVYLSPRRGAPCETTANRWYRRMSITQSTASANRYRCNISRSRGSVDPAARRGFNYKLHTTLPWIRLVVSLSPREHARVHAATYFTILQYLSLETFP